MNSNDMNERGGAAPLRSAGHGEDLLLARVIERTDSRSDWSQLKRLAAADIQVWSRLAQSLESESQLRSSSQELRGVLERNPINWAALAAADKINAAQTTPSGSLADSNIVGAHRSKPHRSKRWVRTISKLAALLLVFLSGWLLADSRGQLKSIESPDSALATSLQLSGDSDSLAQLQETAAIRAADSTELIPLVIDSRPADNGVEITYLRRILEREVVPSLYNVGMNDAELPALERVQLAGDFNTY